MITTSDYYTEHISDKTQKWTNKIIIDYSDYNLDNTISVISDESNDASIDSQIVNGIKTPSFKYWNWEDFEWGMHLYDSNKQYEQGGISQQLSGADKTFPEGGGAIYGAAIYGAGIYSGAIRKPSFTVNFTERSVNALEVVFDEKLVHYAEEFKIKIYQGTILAHTENVTGNNGTLWSKTLSSSYSDVTSLEVVIDKWNVVNSPARILEFYTSVQEIYYDDDILSFSISEESEPDMATSPIGNVTANSCEISLVNRDSYFDNDNEDSPLQNNLVKNRRVRLFTGLRGDEDEVGNQNYVQLGTYYTQSWTNDNYSATAGASGRDIVQLLSENSYSSSQFIETPEDQTFTYTSTADFSTFDLDNLSATNNELQFGGEPCIYSSNGGAYFGAAVYGAGIYNGKFYYGSATKTVTYDYTSGTSVKIALDKTAIQGLDKISYLISTDSGVSYSEITDTFSYVPDIDAESQSFILKVMFVVQSVGTATSIQDITLTVSGNVTLYSLAVKVLNDFDDETSILDKKYTIDSALGEISIPNAYLDVQSYQEAIKLICEAGAARAYSTRDGYLAIKQVGSDPVYELERDIDSYFVIANSTNSLDLYNRVSIMVNPLTKSGTLTEIASLSETISASTTETYTISFTEDPSSDVVHDSSTLPSDVTITDATYYTWGADIEITNTNSTEQDITILLEGYPYTVDGAYEISLDDSDSIRKHGVSELSIDNSLIQTQAQANAINSLLISSFKSQKRLVESYIQYDPSLEIADGINIDSKGYDTYSQTISYDTSGLVQQIKGVKR